MAFKVEDVDISYSLSRAVAILPVILLILEVI